MRSTSRYFDNRPLVRMRNSFLKLFSKRKKQKKKKAILTRRTGGRTKRKRNKSRRVAGQSNTITGRSHLFALPLCRSLLVGWCGGCPPYICYLFVHFFNPFQSKKGYKKHVKVKDRVFLVCFPLSVQNSLNE